MPKWWRTASVSQNSTTPSRFGTRLQWISIRCSTRCRERDWSRYWTGKRTKWRWNIPKKSVSNKKSIKKWSIINYYPTTRTEKLSESWNKLNFRVWRTRETTKSTLWRKKSTNTNRSKDSWGRTTWSWNRLSGKLSISLKWWRGSLNSVICCQNRSSRSRWPANRFSRRMKNSTQSYTRPRRKPWTCWSSQGRRCPCDWYNNHANINYGEDDVNLQMGCTNYWLIIQTGW